MTNFPYSGHFIDDAGPFQVGIAASMLRWRDSLGVVLAAFLVANSVHTVNYIADLRLGGHPADAWGLGALSVITEAALVARGRHIKARESPAQVRSVRATDRRCSKNDAKAMP